jgi:DNA-binding NarL/FixJ family response regulator
MSKVLERDGFEVTCVGDVDDALEQLANGEYDVLISDIYMPGNHDLRLVQEVAGAMPVIVVTGAPSIPTAVSAVRSAAFDYLVKPVDPNTLVERTRAAVEKARAMRLLSASRASLVTMAERLESLEAAFAGAMQSATGPGERPRDPLDGLSAAERDALSPRETEVIVAMARGQRVNEIAKSLFISPHTVRNHLKSIFRKLDVSSQVELLAKLSGARP